MREIPLTQDKVALVDDEDYAKLSTHKWYAHKENDLNTWYAARKSRGDNGQSITILMHALIVNPENGLVTDHKNGNGLDNRRDNLRPATTVQNAQNKKKNRGNTSSIYKGVHWHIRDKYWIARITYLGKKRHIGMFDNETEAASAYDAKARELFGEFARLNFP